MPTRRGFSCGWWRRRARCQASGPHRSPQRCRSSRFRLQFSAVVPEGEEVREGKTVPPAWANCIDERYFEVMGIPLLAGRAFAPTDDAGAPAVAIVNEALARHTWPNGNPIGQRAHLLDDRRKLVEIVGIVKTTTLRTARESCRRTPSTFRIASSRAGRWCCSRKPPVTPLRRWSRSASSCARHRPRRARLRRPDDGKVLRGRGSPARVQIWCELVGGMGLMGMTLTMIGLYGLVSYTVEPAHA